METKDTITTVECPRDAMQGIHEFIPTSLKIEYLNLLLKCGFDTLDFGSFVSPKAIPQLRDTAEVIDHLYLENTRTKLLAIIANLRGAEDAVNFEQISYLGFPFSISETFQLRNTNSTILQSLDRVQEIQELCKKTNKELVIYISMAFGNPYNDPWNPELAGEWIEKLHALGIREFSLADTTGVSGPENIGQMFSALLPAFPDCRIGAHLHSTPEDSAKKISAAFESGCRRFDSALFGYGGCPMASDELTGNISTQILLHTMKNHLALPGIHQDTFREAESLAQKVFSYH